jgi:hypothetical protein
MIALFFYSLLILLGLWIIRDILVVTGVYKDPILRRFEIYGNDEDTYSPVITLVLACYLLILLLLIVLAGRTPLMILVALSWSPLYIFYQYREKLIEKFPQIFLYYPTWHYRLLWRTSREERRRIAYLWLFLPLRTRMLYSTHDAFFHQWTDMVLLTMV